MKNRTQQAEAAPASGQHTALPWSLTDVVVYDDDTGKHAREQLVNEHGRAGLLLTHDGSEEGYANAEMVKVAVNSHAALLEALRQIAEMAEGRSRVNMPDGTSLALFARAAIAQAEGRVS